ncbi:MAG: hypothetical protein HQL76_06335 [Magnetococcales bacterium]|nr:hypothetical protein [Magnetococcales bacterium]
MSSPLFDLRELLSGNAPVAGMVISIDHGVAQVATRKGVVEVAAEGIRVGNRVVVKDGRAVRVQDVVDAPVFLV